MGLMDKVKGLVSGNKEQAKDAVDKVADVVDDRTGGQHTDKIEDGAEKLKEGIDKLAE